MLLEYSDVCHYCGGVVRLVSAKSVYGNAAAMRLGLEDEQIWQCQNCNARVGCHKGTTKPLGKVANEFLRNKRMEAHEVFDGYWRERGISRGKAYKWLAGKLGMPVKKTHIGGFDVAQCQKVIDVCVQEKSKEAA